MQARAVAGSLGLLRPVCLTGWLHTSQQLGLPAATACSQHSQRIAKKIASCVETSGQASQQASQPVSWAMSRVGAPHHCQLWQEDQRALYEEEASSMVYRAV